MNCVILTRSSQEIGFVKNVLKLEDFDCKIALDLCQLERYGRNFVLEFLFIDKDYFRYPSDEDFIRGCLGILNGNIPIIYVDKNNLEQSIDICKNDELKILKPEVLIVFENVLKRIEKFNKISADMLRPAEKKLYTLLKNNNQRPISLEEMCLFLWGTSSEGHTKTVYSYIHRIKKILDENADHLEWVQKEKKGFYKIQIKPIVKDCQICPECMDLFL